MLVSPRARSSLVGASMATLRDFFKSPAASKPAPKPTAAAFVSPAGSPLFSPTASAKEEAAAAEVPVKQFFLRPVQQKAVPAATKPPAVRDLTNSGSPNAALTKAPANEVPAAAAAAAKPPAARELTTSIATDDAKPEAAGGGATAAGRSDGLRDSASLQAELETIVAKYAAPEKEFLAVIKGFGMKLDNELRKAKGQVTDSLLGLLAQGSRLPATDLADYILEQLQQLAQSELVTGAELPGSSREILDRLPAVAELITYGDAKAEDLQAKMMIWEMKSSAVSKLQKPYKDRVTQELKRSRDEKKADKKRLALLRTMIKNLSRTNYLDKPKNLEKFVQDCAKVLELATGAGDADRQTPSKGAAPGSPTSSGSNSAELAPQTQAQIQRAAELRKAKEAEELETAAKKAALAEEQKQKDEQAALAKAARQEEREKKAQAEREEKERLRQEKVEADKLDKEKREAEKAAEQAEKLRLRAEAKLQQDREAEEEKQRKQAERDRKAEEKLRKEEAKEAEKVRKQEEREAEKRRKQEEKEAAKTRKAEEEAERIENQLKKQKKAQSAWANFGFVKKKEKAAVKPSSSASAPRSNGPKKKLWKWESSLAWKLTMHDTKVSAELAAATAQVPWALTTLDSDSLQAMLKEMRQRQALRVKPKIRRAGRRPTKFLDFRGCPFQKKHGHGHPQEGQDVRPPWYGPMDPKKTTSNIVTGRTPLKMEKEDVVDYDLDSEDEYEGDAEDIENSDGEEDKDDDEDEEGGFVVPDGTFSDDEGVEGDGDRLVGISTTSSTKEVIVMTGSSLPTSTVHISMQVAIRGPDIFSPYDCDETGQNLLQKEEKAKKLKEKEEDKQKKQEERNKKQVQDSMLLDLVRLVHGTTKGKDKIQEEFLEVFPHVGKSQFATKLNDIALKEKRVALEGSAAKNRWWIRPEVLQSVGLTEEDLPVVDIAQSPSNLSKHRSNKRSLQDAGTGTNKAQNTQFWQKVGVKTTQSVCDEANATWSELEEALARFVRPPAAEAAGPQSKTTSSTTETPVALESPKSTPLKEAEEAPGAEQLLVELWDILTTTSKGEVREAASETIQKILVEVANTELASSARAFLANLVTATFADPNLKHAVEPLLEDGLPCKLLNSIQPLDVEAMAASPDAQTLTGRVLRLLMYFFKRHASADTDASAAVDTARLEMLGGHSKFILDCVACPADADTRKQVRGAASGLFHQLLSVPTLKLCAVPLSPQHLLVKTGGECFKACVEAMESAAGPAAVKFLVLAISRLVVLGDGAKCMMLDSLRSIEQPIATALELVKKDYMLLEALPCALALLEQLPKTGEASEKLVKAVAHLFDIALGRPATAASNKGGPHSSAQEWLQQCCKLAGCRAAAQQLTMPVPQNELRAKALAAVQQVSTSPKLSSSSRSRSGSRSRSREADTCNAAAVAVLKALALKLAQ